MPWHINIIESANSFQNLNGFLGLRGRLNFVRDDKRDLRHIGNLVTPGHNQRRDSRCSKGSSGGVAALVHVDLAMPFAPNFGGRKHASATTHVAEGSLTGTVGTTTAYTGDTRHGATSTPRFSGSLMTGIDIHTVCLPLVLRHVRVSELAL